MRVIDRWSLRKCRWIWIIGVLILFCTSLYGETGSNSPYTRYGIGDLCEVNSIVSKSMGGVGYALQSAYYTNTLNPASYAVFDSLNFVFDIGAGFSLASYKENGNTDKYWNGRLHHVLLRFPVSKKIAVSAGFIPYSTVGYNYNVSKGGGDKVLYSGSGGLSQLFAGVACRPSKNFCVGLNLVYLFGFVRNGRELNFSDTTSHNLYKVSDLDVKTFKMDIGVQYTIPFNRYNRLTLGLVFSPGWKENAEITNYELNEKQKIDTTKSNDSRFDLPINWGIGICYHWKGKYTLAGDVQLQQWSKAYYYNKTDTLKNRVRVALGFEYIPKVHDRSFAKNIRYRCGISYDNLYYNVNNKKVTDLGFSLGVGLPLRRNKTFVNVGLEYIMRRSEDNNLLKEDYFKLNLGISINERWFARRRFN
ncbi:MAG TPA: hypothetical protein DDY68_02625 [Porphyromonadaceae bacterium]|nr:hypothetical protein [Porphyromonadaceae bacterium]